MARKKKPVIPEYGTISIKGAEYYRTRIYDTDGKRVTLYGKTREELYEKVQDVKKQIEEMKYRRATPTVADYCEK